MRVKNVGALESKKTIRLICFPFSKELILMCNVVCPIACSLWKDCLTCYSSRLKMVLLWIVYGVGSVFRWQVLSRHIADVHDNECDVPTAKVLWFSFFVPREVRHMYYWRNEYMKDIHMKCGYIVNDEINEMILAVWKQFKQLHFYSEKTARLQQDVCIITSCFDNTCMLLMPHTIS